MTISSPTVKRLPKSRVHLSFEIAASDVKRYWKKTLERYRQQVTIRGFRKGRVPDELLLQRHSGGIERDAKMLVINDALRESLKSVEERPLQIDTPRLENDPSFHPEKELAVVVSYDTYPSVDIGVYRGRTVRVPPPPNVDGVGARLKKMQRQYATLVPRSTTAGAREGDSVTIDYSELEEGRVTGGRNNARFVVGDEHAPPFLKGIIGLKVGEERTVSTSATATTVIKVRELQTQKLPRLDDAFAGSYGGGVKTVQALKKKLQTEMREEKERVDYRERCSTLLEDVIKESSFEIPQSMIRHELGFLYKQFLYRNGLSEEQMEEALKSQNKRLSDVLKEWQPLAEQAIAQRIVKAAIVEHEKITVSDQEFEAFLRTYASESHVQITELKKKGSVLDRLREDARDNKLFEWLLRENTCVVDKKLKKRHT